MPEVTTNNNIQCTIALAVLQDVTDPEIGLNIVDLGLIYEINFNEAEKLILLRMTLTTQFCPMGEPIKEAAQRRMEEAFPGYQVIIELVFDPPWTAGRISPEGQEWLDR
jgi:metal-sulfur cluster biosynthetic enzyme